MENYNFVNIPIDVLADLTRGATESTEGVRLMQEQHYTRDDMQRVLNAYGWTIRSPVREKHGLATLRQLFLFDQAVQRYGLTPTGTRPKSHGELVRSATQAHTAIGRRTLGETLEFLAITMTEHQVSLQRAVHRITRANQAATCEDRTEETDVVNGSIGRESTHHYDGQTSLGGIPNAVANWKGTSTYIGKEKQ
ncbi:MAG: hypothetical protein Q7R96_03595 [Nanoarchaeota archaeon]|nr:hypothetical protein [Nanoarchaeota archaeon]